MTRLGAGDFCGELLVMMPSEVEEQLESHRELHSEMFADNYRNEQPIEQQDVDECVQLAGTYEGDSMVICPRHPGMVFILPRHSEVVRVVETGFNEPSRLCFDEGWEPDFEFFEARNGKRNPRAFRYETHATAEGLLALFQSEFRGGTHVRKVGEDESSYLQVFVQALTASITISNRPKQNQLSVNAILDDECEAELDTFMRIAEEALSMSPLSTVAVSLPRSPEPQVTLRASLNPQVFPESFSIGPFAGAPLPSAASPLAAANSISNLSISSDGRTLVAVGLRAISLWDLISREMLWKVVAHDDWINDVAFSPDGKLLATASSEIRIWNISLQEEIVTLPSNPHHEKITSIDFSPAGTQLISTGHDGIVRLWNVGPLGLVKRFLQGREVAAKSVPESKRLCGAMFLADGQPIGIRSDEHRTFLWNILTDVELFVLETHRTITEVFVAHDHTQVATWGGGWGAIDVWTLATGEVSHRLADMPNAEHSVAFHPDGRHVAVGLQDADIWLWDLEQQCEIGRLGQSGQSINSIAFSDDGSYIVAPSGDRVLVWLWKDIVTQAS